MDSIDRLSRQMFKAFVEGHSGSRTCGACYHRATGNHLPSREPDRQPIADAWFRLVDRGLIRPHAGVDLDSAGFMLTEKGRASRYHEGALDDPQPEIDHLRRTVGHAVDSIVECYLTEALKAQQAEHLISALIMVGIAGEQVTIVLAGWLAQRVQRSAAALSNPRSAEHRIEACIAAVEELRIAARKAQQQAPDLELVRVGLGTLAEAYRLTRNELAHPQAPPALSESHVELMLLSLLRDYLPAIYRLMAS